MVISCSFDNLGILAPYIEICGCNYILYHVGTFTFDRIKLFMTRTWHWYADGIYLLVNMEVKRCLKPKEFGKVNTIELHHFLDASCEGYGQCSYLRLVDDSNRIHCSLIIRKFHVTPLKQVSIPRLELTAAIVSIKVSTMLQDEPDHKNVLDIYWMDSKVVLGWVNNKARWFHVFVSNCVQQIRDCFS